VEAEEVRPAVEGQQQQQQQLLRMAERANEARATVTHDASRSDQADSSLSLFIPTF
jgi:hypothetical protein